MGLLLVIMPRLLAQTDEEKQQEFLNARGDGDSASPSPSAHHRKHAEEEATPRHHHSPTPEETATPEGHRHHHVAEEAVTPARRRHGSPTPERSARKRTDEEEESSPTPTPTPMPVETPQPVVVTPSPSVTPPPQAVQVRQPYQSTRVYTAPAVAALPQATPAPTPAPGPWGAQIDIQKEGLEEQGGYEPPPPPPVRHHWWQFFGGGPEPQYQYLTREVREAIDRAPVARNRWRFIVVHNSGTRQGNARIFDYYHRYVRHMPNGLAYQFVIGNGTSSGNGQIEVGNRWVRQINGGHVHSDYLNNIALGICLVGDFNRDLPTKAQLEALDELIRYLRIRVGKIDGKPAIVKAHKEINPPQWPTDCPGDRFPYHWLHSRFD